MPVTEQFQQWALGYSGCDGGDLGNSDRPSVWVCGIEWGGGHGEGSLRREMEGDVSTPPPGYEDWQENVKFRFNWNVMKLLGSVEGYAVEDYKKFARVRRPFVKGGSGYFKLNLFPIGFRKTDSEFWVKSFGEITGFSSKDEYLSWCRKNRLERMKRWTQECRPELVLCLGKTYEPDFACAFSVNRAEWVTETIDGKDLSWAKNEHGALVVVVPFMSSANGLKKNVSIQKFGTRIAQIKESLA